MIISRTLKNGNPRITLHPLWRVTHSMTSVSRWPGVMCCGNGYLLWERVNKAGKTHKIPCVNRVWAGGCEEMGLGERERERAQWTLGVMAGGAGGGGNLCTGMSRDRVSSGVVCDPDIDSQHDLSSLLWSLVRGPAVITGPPSNNYTVILTIHWLSLHRKTSWMSLKMKKKVCMRF